MLGRSLQQIKSDVGEKGDLGIVAEVSIVNYCILSEITAKLYKGSWDV